MGAWLRLAMVSLCLGGCATTTAPREEEQARFARFCEGVCAEVRGNFEAAKEAYQEAAVAGESNPALLIALARTQVVTGEPEAALASLKTAWNSGQRDLGVLRCLASLCYQVGDEEGAIRFNADLIHRDPASVRPVYYLEQVLSAQGRLDEAIRILSQVENSPRASDYLRQRLSALRNAAIGGERPVAETTRHPLRRR